MLAYNCISETIYNLDINRNIRNTKIKLIPNLAKQAVTSINNNKTAAITNQHLVPDIKNINKSR